MVDLFIDHFVDFYQKYPGRKQAFLLALSLCDTCQYFSKIGQLDRIDAYSRQLAQLYTEYPDVTVLFRSRSLAGACFRFSICDKIEKMNEYLAQMN